ncbi:MAG TPA: pyridoxamine 5'-phosphate oxidase family protein [Candidatus Absconditabacterales bacterium]|nr:pyridoxamine 5'-phosphate oxidase family protein [Candidatus Absconditabacterales bacterium]
MNWKEIFGKGHELVLSTSSLDGKPNANIVISLGFFDNKLLISDAQMKQTIENLKSNKLICITAINNGKYYRIKGSVEIFNSGKYFDLCNTDKKYPAKNAILVNIEEVFDLDGVQVINK